MAGSFLDLMNVKTSGFLEQHAKGVRPWMAFFTTWSAFLDYQHSMDVEAFHIARELGKDIAFLETIADQLNALDGIPFDRIVNYFHQFQHWSTHRELFSKVFLKGNVPNYLSITGEFPTRCESIIGKRDPIFFQGIRASIEKGQQPPLWESVTSRGSEKCFSMRDTVSLRNSHDHLRARGLYRAVCIRARTHSPIRHPDFTDGTASLRRLSCLCKEGPFHSRRISFKGSV